MSVDIMSSTLPEEIRAKLAELELELSEGRSSEASINQHYFKEIVANRISGQIMQFFCLKLVNLCVSEREGKSE